MPMEWTAEVVARMHMLRLTSKELSELTGYTPQYISMVLNGHRDTQGARSRIEDALRSAEEGSGA